MATLRCAPPAIAGGGQPCVYFLVTLEFCDHILFYEDGTFFFGATHRHGRQPDRGCWKLSRGRGSAAEGGWVVELHWEVDGTADQVIPDELVSAGSSCHKFSGGSSSLEHVSGEMLTVPATEAAAKAAGPKRSLVFSSVGNQCLPVVRDHWLRSPAQMDFDVALVFYKEPTSDVFNELQELAAKLAPVSLHVNAGMKWPNFRHWMELYGGPAAVASNYDYVWVVDDDVRLSTEDVSRMFSILREHPEVEFACPSFDAGSDGVWRFFDGHDPRYKLRYTNFVECTAPVLKAAMLLDPIFQPCLRAVRTGCYIDFCFHEATGRRADSVAVIDAVQCHHPPRSEASPSEMRKVQAWEEHKNDDVYFEQEGVPKEWWCIEPRFFQPRVLGGIPAAASPPHGGGSSSSASGGGSSGGGAQALVLPPLGLGTAFYPEDHERGPEEEVVARAVEAALQAGVRLFDCANRYSSQRHVGAALAKAVQRGVVARGDLVIVAKLAEFGSRAEVAAGVDQALSELGMDYVNVLMPHIPVSPQAWRWFEEEVKLGHARHLGVSNYDQLDTSEDGQDPGSSDTKGVAALRALLSEAAIKPSVHEFELHPLLQNSEMVEFCQAESIQILAYSPLGAPHKVEQYVGNVQRQVGEEAAADRRLQLSVLEHPGVAAISRIRGIEPALVVLRWHLDRGFVPIPKSWDAAHVAANAPGAVASMPAFSAPEMAVLNALDSGVRTVVLYHKGMRGEL